MTQRRHSQPIVVGDREYTFRNVQLLKNETLGTGSYGAVCKVKCDQLMCAAKLLYPVLFQMQAPDPGKEHRQPFHRFEQECECLSRISHPNIVQYLGTYRDPETNAPVLLMELMDQSLTHYLETSAGDIPYHIQVNIASDIAQALAFLHANGIIHRDLSSNNVLLIAESRAKVTDFGMSKFCDMSREHLGTMTTCPGTPVFMPPEALDEPPVYTEKLDTFSFGVLLVQIVTRQFPKPTDRFKTRHLIDPISHQSICAKVVIPEAERRQAHSSLIEPNHPLLPTALHCLKDKEVERPSSQQLCQSLEALKGTDRYEDSLRQDTAQLLQVRDQQIRDKDNQLQAKDEQLREQDELLQVKDEQLRAKDDSLQAKETDMAILQHEIANRDTHLRKLHQQLEANEEITGKLQHTIVQQDREISELREMLARAGNGTLEEKHHKITMVWRAYMDFDCPEDISGRESVVIGNIAYCKRSHTFRIAYLANNPALCVYVFDIPNKKWTKQALPAPLWGSTFLNSTNSLQVLVL